MEEKIKAAEASKAFSEAYRKIWQTEFELRPAALFLDSFEQWDDPDNYCPDEDEVKEWYGCLGLNLVDADLGDGYLGPGGIFALVANINVAQDKLHLEFVQEAVQALDPADIVALADGSKRVYEIMHFGIEPFREWKSREFAAGRTHGLSAEMLSWETAWRPLEKGNDVKIPMLGDGEAKAPMVGMTRNQGLER